MTTSENQKLAQELDKATQLKTYLVSDDPAVEALVEKYLALIKEDRKATRNRDSKYRQQLKILICNLVWVSVRKNQWLYQGYGSHAFKQTRYFSGLTQAVFVKGILKTLEALELLEVRRGYQSVTKSRATRFRARGRLKADIKKILPHGISQDMSRETIWIQRTKDSWFDKRTRKVIKIKEKVDYQDNTKTNQMRESLQIINNKLDEVFIGLWIPDTEYRKLNSKLRKSSDIELDFRSKYLDRIFNDTDFTYGGRFYHGWWQAIPKIYRPYITINHQLTVELDYKHLHPAMLYDMEGMEELPLWWDAYTLDLEGFSEDHRNELKLVFQYMINNGSIEGVLNTIKSKTNLSLFSLNAKELLDLMINKHKPIEEYFFKEETGKQLQRVDCDIAEYCMLEMLNRHGSLILPVHDSFLVQQDMVQHLKGIMTEAYSKFVSPKVRIDEKSFRLWHPFDGLHPDEVNLYKKYKEQALLHLKRFNRVTNEPFMPPEVFPEG